jgi:inosine-uridine nucleoside N-ribohydrolase
VAPVLVEQRQRRAPEAAALSYWVLDRLFPRGLAVEFLRRTVRAHPGEVELLAIGPLTNIALLFAVDPEIPALLKGLVLMCGVFTDRLPGVGPLEWNALVDPHAAAIVYRAAQGEPAAHRSIGLDVTCQVTMAASDIRATFRHDLLRPVLDFAEVWFERAQTLTFHDPLAAATIFDDRICSFERGAIELELADEQTLGRTYWRPGGAGARHEAALAVDRERFLDHFFGVFQ